MVLLAKRSEFGNGLTHLQKSVLILMAKTTHNMIDVTTQGEGAVASFLGFQPSESGPP